MTGAERLPVVGVSTGAEAVRVSPRLQVGHSPHGDRRRAERESEEEDPRLWVHQCLCCGRGLVEKRAILSSREQHRHTRHNQLTGWGEDLGSGTRQSGSACMQVRCR